MLNKITTAAAIVALATTGVVNARSYDKVSFNLGGELSINKPSFSKTIGSDLKKALDKNKAGANVFVGARFNQYFGAELGYGFIAKTKGNATDSDGNNASVTNKATNIYVDALGYLPVATKVDLIGAVGVGRLANKGTIYSSKAESKYNKVGARVGVGAQYNVTDNVAARAMVRYQQGNKDFQKANTSLAIGAAYTF